MWRVGLALCLVVGLAWGGMLLSSQMAFSRAAKAVFCWSGSIQPIVALSAGTFSCCNDIAFGCILWRMSSPNPISVAVQLVGLQALAKSVGVTYQMIQKYKSRGASAERVRMISAATGWRVTPHMVRPDLYPNPTDALPAAVACEVAAGCWKSLAELERVGGA